MMSTTRWPREAMISYRRPIPGRSSSLMLTGHLQLVRSEKVDGISSLHRPKESLLTHDDEQIAGFEFLRTFRSRNQMSDVSPDEEWDRVATHLGDGRANER